MSRSDKKGNQSPQVTERARTPAGDSAKQKIPEAKASGNLLEVTTRFELVDEGFADPCLTTWPRHHIGSDEYHSNGAADEARTRYLHLGKVALYQMSYGRTFHLFVPGFRPATLVIIPHTPAVVNHKFTFFQKRMSFCSDTFFFILRAARTPPFSPCFTPLCARVKYSCFLFHKLL